MSLPNPINVTYVSPQSGDTFPFIYIVKDTDNIINIDTTHGAVHVILRNIRNSGMLQYQPLLSINDGGNNASVNNITIYPSEGDIINDSDFYILNDNGANSIIQLSNINQWVVSSSQSGGAPPIPFGGTNYIYVYANGTDTENATELQNAYNLAKTMSPSATNRITIVCGLGYYNFGISVFTLDTQYIDVVPLDGNRSIIFNATESKPVTANGTIKINANNVFVKGINVGGKPFQVSGNNLNSIVVENCKGGNYSFNDSELSGYEMSGTFINCEGGSYSFGGSISLMTNPIVSGRFIDCISGEKSFGGGDGLGTASGFFKNCQSIGDSSFGYIASGNFSNCTSSNYSFAYSGTASGVFNNCEANVLSFGANGSVLGTFNNCIGGADSWVSLNMTAKIWFSRHSGGNSAPSPSLGGNIVAFITANNNFIAQNP
jgi:hypothetical protein